MRRFVLPRVFLPCLFTAVAIAPLAGACDDPPPASTPAATRPAASAAAACPVTGGPIDRSIYTYFRGKRVYFATPAARDRFMASPTDFADGIRTQWAALRPLRVQVKCPVTGDPIRLTEFVDTVDRRIYFASPAAKERWGAASTSPAAADLQRRLGACYTYQVHCGLCENEINPTVFEDFGSRRVYFCCHGCAREFGRGVERGLQRVEDEVRRNREAFQARNAGDAPAKRRGSGATNDGESR